MSLIQSVEVAAALIGRVLLHSLWQGALIGVAFGLARQALRRRSANLRYAAGCISLALLLLAPVVTAWTLAKHSDANDATVARGGAAIARLPFGNGNASATGSVGDGISGLIQSTLGLLGRVAPFLALGWVLGVAFQSAMLTRGWWEQRALNNAEGEPVEEACLRTLNDLRWRLGISRPVRLLQSALVEVPTVVGWLRPLILLPASTMTGLTPAELESILAHELAHVQRWDYAMNALQCAVETLLFYHPVAHWISVSIREERENCCDDIVVRICGNRLTYARALAALEEARSGIPALAFAASGGSLKGRIRRIIGLGPESSRPTATHISGLALVGIGLALIITGFVQLAGAPLFQATARVNVQVHRGRQAWDPGENEEQNVYNPYHIQTEFAVIQSEQVLQKVVKALDLAVEWGRKYGDGKPLRTEQATALLRRGLEIRAVRNTSLIELSFRSENPEEAAKVAGAIADAYQLFCREADERAKSRELRHVQAQLDIQDRAVRDARQEMERLGRDLRVPDAVVRDSGVPVLLSAESIRRLETMRIETKAKLVGDQTLLMRLRSMRENEGAQAVAQAIPTAVSDPLLTDLSLQLAQAEQRLVALNHDYGEQHPEVIKTTSQIQDLKTKISNRVGGVLLGLEARIDASSDPLIQLEQQVEASTRGDVAMAERLKPYFEAKQKLENLERLQDVLNVKVLAEQAEANAPAARIVEIIDKPLSQTHPVAPNRPLASAETLLGLVLIILGALLLRTHLHPPPALQPA